MRKKTRDDEQKQSKRLKHAIGGIEKKTKGESICS
jgi:hypothetical protein